jgi:hypothetical protein
VKIPRNKKKRFGDEDNHERKKVDKGKKWREGVNFLSDDTKIYSASNPSTDHTHHRSVGEVAALYGGLPVRAAPKAVYQRREATLVRGNMEKSLNDLAPLAVKTDLQMCLI